MSENVYDIADIMDKKDFAVHLQEPFSFSGSFFNTEEKFLNFYLDEDSAAEEAGEYLIEEIVSDLPKGIITLPDSYFHYFSDFLGPIFMFLKKCEEDDVKEVEVISVALDSELENVKGFEPFLQHCLDQFSEKIKISYRAIEPNKENKKMFIKINNFRVMDQRDIGVSLDFLYKSAKSFAGFSDNTPPSKKVFISRMVDDQNNFVDERHLYQKEAQDFFEKIGYEIIRGEDFENLQSQMTFFNEVKVFVGFTGSGLTSSMFMQPGQKLVEIVSPLKFDQTERYEIHNFYKTISMLKKHTYVGVSNINNSKENLLKHLEDIAKML